MMLFKLFDERKGQLSKQAIIDEKLKTINDTSTIRDIKINNIIDYDQI